MKTKEFLLFKSNIQKVLDRFLYGPPRLLFETAVSEIVLADMVVRQDEIRAFKFKGEIYHVRGERPKVRFYPRLSRGYEASMLALLKEYDPILKDERSLVMAVIAQIMNGSDDPMDYLQWFPSQLRKPLKPVYDHYGISIEGAEFAGTRPPHADEIAYNKMGARIGLNLIGG